MRMRQKRAGPVLCKKAEHKTRVLKKKGENSETSKR